MRCKPSSLLTKAGCRALRLEVNNNTPSHLAPSTGAPTPSKNTVLNLFHTVTLLHLNLQFSIKLKWKCCIIDEWNTYTCSQKLYWQRYCVVWIQIWALAFQQPSLSVRCYLFLQQHISTYSSHHGNFAPVTLNTQIQHFFHGRVTFVVHRSSKLFRLSDMVEINPRVVIQIIFQNPHTSHYVDNIWNLDIKGIWVILGCWMQFEL